MLVLKDDLVKIAKVMATVLGRDECAGPAFSMAAVKR